MDNSSKETGTFGISLQRLREGLQKTIQIFRVYEGDADSRRYRHYPEREEQLETELSTIGLESDYDLSSYDESSNSEGRPCSGKSGIYDLDSGSVSSRSVRKFQPRRYQEDQPCRMSRNVSKRYPRSILKDETDTGSMHSQTSLSLSLNVIKTKSENVENIDSHTAALDHKPRMKYPRRQQSVYVREPESSLKSVSSIEPSQKSVSSMEYTPPPTPRRPLPLPLPEKDSRSYEVDDTGEGPINRFNYALVFADRTSVMRPELLYLLSYLELGGLEVKLVRGAHKNANLVFILVHMPIATLVQETQIQKVRLNCMLPYYPTEEPTKLHWFTMCFAQKQEGPQVPRYDQKVFVTSAEKILFIHQKVDRAKFGPEPEQYGIEEMINEDIIMAAYPLHDGGAQPTWLRKLNDRQNLTAFWGKLARFAHLQPLRLVNRYFGPEIAFYFAWLGYLSCFLTPVAIYGCFVFFAGIISLAKPEDERIKQVCTSDKYMCPLCLNHEHCDFAAIRDSCFYSELNYIFDNQFTLSFPGIMAVWTLIFVIYWKRVENMLKLEWNLYHTNLDSFIRSSFLKQLKEHHIEITYKGEPRIPAMWRIFFRLLTMLMMLIVLGLLCLTAYVLAIIRIALTHKLAVRVDRTYKVNVSLISNGMYYSNIICSVFSGFLIISYSKLFPYLINCIVAIESPRTDREYSVSYTTKLFIFECFNNFGYAIYMAFFREFGFKHPGDAETWKYNGGIKRNMCDPSGCIADLSIYVAIILTIKILYHWLETAIFTYRKSKKNSPIVYIDQWESDYELTPVNYKLYIPTLYMEPVMKYAYVTLFSGAFPLAPIMILIDTAVTIRINATMFCQLLRRPVPRRVVGLEAWGGIIQIVSVCGIIISMYVLWFTTDIVKRSVFAFYNSGGNYLFDTISDFRIRDYHGNLRDVALSHCYYRGNREPADRRDKYRFTLRYAEIIMYEHILTIRYLLGLLAFGGFFYFLIWNHERERPYDEAVEDD